MLWIAVTLAIDHYQFAFKESLISNALAQKFKMDKNKIKRISNRNKLNQMSLEEDIEKMENISEASTLNSTLPHVKKMRKPKKKWNYEAYVNSSLLDDD